MNAVQTFTAFFSLMLVVAMVGLVTEITVARKRAG